MELRVRCRFGYSHLKSIRSRSQTAWAYGSSAHRENPETLEKMEGR